MNRNVISQLAEYRAVYVNEVAVHTPGCHMSSNARLGFALCVGRRKLTNVTVALLARVTISCLWLLTNMARGLHGGVGGGVDW